MISVLRGLNVNEGKAFHRVFQNAKSSYSTAPNKFYRNRKAFLLNTRFNSAVASTEIADDEEIGINSAKGTSNIRSVQINFVKSFLKISS